MTNNELLLAISDMMDKKLKSEIQAELQPLKDDISHIKGDINYMKSDINHLNNDVGNIKSDINHLNDDISNIKSDINHLNDDISNIKSDINHLNDDINSIKMHLENVTDKNIQLLAENYVPAAKRYEKATAKIETMQTDIDVIKSVILEHSDKLQKIS
ncbi:MAG: hypothetical protein HFH59_00945 [Lachnospiraceae bacterium]|nr:hypothetical protein [Lachnospiraceae bacterium]